MVSLEDAVALSVWHGAPRLRVMEFLRREPDALSLELILDVVRPMARSVPDATDLRRAAACALKAARAAGIDAIPWGAADYPRLLASIPDAPFVLWLQGRPEALAQPTVAIVGSRAASSYGLDAASRLAGDLAVAGAVVVSGLARGIDSAAHRGALSAGGDTVSVLGSGVNVIYPPEHRALAAAIAGHGAVVSELPPGSPPKSCHFPARNRIISGLSLAVVVVEAAEGSGSLITADFALEQGRAVMAVPGNILSGRHRGSHGLIREGAAVVESAEDIIAELKTSSLRPRGDPAAGAAAASHPILGRMVAGESYDLDTLQRETGLGPAQLLPALLELELLGDVRRADGGRFVRARRSC